MKRILYVILASLLLLTALTACGDSSKTLNKENEEEQASKTEDEEKTEEVSDKKPKDITDGETVYNFFATLNSEVSRADYDSKWEKQYIDVTGDGSDEVMIYNEFGMNDDIIIVDVKDGEFVTIKSNMTTAKPKENITTQDGFIKSLQQFGGTGAYYDHMMLYKYNGKELVQVLNLQVAETVAAPNTNYVKNAEIKGDLTNFEYTFTKEENGKKTIEEHAIYTYNEDKMAFDIEKLSSETKLEIVHLRDIHNGMKLNGGVVENYLLKNNGDFSFVIGGELVYSGWVSYSDYFQSISFVSEDGFETKIKLNESKTLEGIDFTFDNYSEFLKMLGTENVSKLKNNMESRLYLTVKVKNHTIAGEEFYLGRSVDIVDIVEIGE